MIYLVACILFNIILIFKKYILTIKIYKNV